MGRVPVPRRARRRVLLVVAAVAATALAVPSPAGATPPLDQSFTGPSNGSYTFDGPSHFVAQTFTPGDTGPLSEVDLAAFASGTCVNIGLHVEIRSVTPAGEPSSTALASTVVPQVDVVEAGSAGRFVQAVFASPATVTAGVQYAIVASAPDALGQDCEGAPPDTYGWDAADPGSYAGGKSLISGFGGSAAWEAQHSGTIDQLFKTYVGTDTTAPATTIALNPATPNGTNGWYTSAVGVTVSATDADDTFLRIRCRVDPSTAPANYDDLPDGACALTSLTAEGTHTVYAASADVAGNTSPVVSTTVKIDRTAPATSFSLSPLSPNGSNGWYTSLQSAGLNASDATSDVAETRCILDPATVPSSFDDLPACSLSVALFADGVHTFYAASVDFAGNKGPVVGRSYKIDSVAPETTIAPTPGSPNGSNGWYTSAVGLTLSGSDATSGVDVTRCALDPATAPSSVDDLPAGACALTSVGTDGVHTIYAASVDAAGNKEATVRSASFQIDRTAPTLAPTTSPATVLLNQTGVVAEPNAADPTSGVATSSCGAGTTATAGDHTVTCTATDNAGNGASTTIHYTVEYRLSEFFSPAASSKWKAGQTVPVKIELGDVAGTRITDAQAAALASGCRVTFSVTGAQTLASQCMTYDASTHQFTFNWKLAKSGTGAATIKVAVTYPGTTATTVRTRSITIVR